MIDLNTLVILDEVVRQKSFTKASAILGMPSSNVSRRIQALEESLGVPLLYRTTRSVAATDEGLAIIELGKGAIETHRNLSDWHDVRDAEPQGRLTITAPESFAQWPLSDWLIEFKQRYPCVVIEILSDSHTLKFDEHHLDFAFRFGTLDDSNLIVKTLAPIPFGFFVQREWLAEQGGVKEIDQWHEWPAISCLYEHGVLPWQFRIHGEDRVVHPKPNFSAKDQLIALKACQAGLGVAFLPVALVKKFDSENALAPIWPAHWPAPFHLQLLYRHRTEQQSLRHKVWLSFLLEKLAEEWPASKP